MNQAIHPVSAGAESLKPGDPQVSHAWDEASLVVATQYLLSINGRTYSEAALRDLGNVSTPVFGPLEAVSALRAAGFTAAFGALAPTAITPSHCPLIVFDKDGSAMTLVEIGMQGDCHLVRAGSTTQTEIIPRVTMEAGLLPYAILARPAAPTVTTGKKRRDWFWNSVTTEKWLYAQVILAAVLTNFLGLSTSLFTMVVYDRIVPNEAIESLIAMTIGILVALGFDFVIKTLRAQFIDQAGKSADMRMSRLIFDKLLTMRLDTRQRRSGALATVVREFDTLRDFFTSATLVAIVDLPFIFLFIWVIYLVSGPLALIPLVAVPLVIATGLVVQPLMARIAAGSLDSSMSKQSVLVETLNGLETVQATGSGRLMRRRFEEATQTQSDLSMKNRILTQFAINSAASVQQLAQVATIFFGVFLIQDKQITMGAMIAAVILGGRTLAPLTQLASALSRANAARQAYRSIDALMQEGAGSDEIGEGTRLSRPHLTGAVELKNVSYSFPGTTQPIIRNLSLKIPAGQHVAILGRMGSGKTTLARLIAGLITPTEGAVLIDGVDLRQIDKSDLRRNVGVMLQETWLFSGTLRENIQMGYYEYDDEHILSVARLSGVDDFVAGHPQGYDMVLRERGEGLSGGQRQAINLARAVLHAPSLVVLDEPTSSLDTTSEDALLKRLKVWLQGRTLVAITHRNSLLSVCDRVLVIDKGAVIADTTPDKLRGKQEPSHV